MSLVQLTSNLALLGYALASVVYLAAFQRSARQALIGRASFAIFAAATISATVALGLLGQDATLTDMAGLLLAVVVAWLAIAGHVLRMRLIGAFVAPLATLILLMKSFFASARPAAESAAESSLLLDAHIAAAIIGQAFAIIACAVSILYLWQQNLLKKKLLDQLPQNLPAIDRLSSLLVISLWSGFVFLTLGLLSGAVYMQGASLGGRGLEAKIIWAICVWVWYLAILLARNVFNRPSKRIAQMSLAGFLLIAIAYFGIGFFRVTSASGGGG